MSDASSVEDVHSDDNLDDTTGEYPPRDETETKRDAFHRRIRPLVESITRLCRRYGINFAAQYLLDREGNGIRNVIAFGHNSDDTGAELQLCRLLALMDPEAAREAEAVVAKLLSMVGLTVKA